MSIAFAVNVTAAVIAGSALLAAALYLPWRMRGAYRQTFIALARAVESREPHLLGHAERTAHYVVWMGRWCGMTPWAVRCLEDAALVHGIGKVGVPYGLLNNPPPSPGEPASLSSTDLFVLRDYVRVGAAVADAIPALRPAADIIRLHHEYHDGSGYPFGRYGRGIPFRAQMLCVASEYVAMTTPRVYRPGEALSPAQAVAHLRCHAGSRYHRGAVLLLLLAKRTEDISSQARIVFGHWVAVRITSLPRRIL